MAPFSSVAQQQYSHSGDGPAFVGNDLAEYSNDQIVKPEICNRKSIPDIKHFEIGTYRQLVESP